MPWAYPMRLVDCGLEAGQGWRVRCHQVSPMPPSRACHLLLSLPWGPAGQTWLLLLPLLLLPLVAWIAAQLAAVVLQGLPSLTAHQALLLTWPAQPEVFVQEVRAVAVCPEPWQWLQGLVQACPRLGLLGLLAWLLLAQRQPPSGLLPQNRSFVVIAV